MANFGYILKPLMNKELAEKLNRMPIVFIVGHGRSGTTLLQSLLNNHPNIAAPAENEFIMYLYPRFGKIKQWRKEDIIQFVDALFFYSPVNLWHLNKEELTSTLLGVIDFANFPLLCKMVLCSTAKNKNDISLVSDKNPINSLFVPTLLSIFPNAKFIHVIRDPRDSISAHIKRLKDKNAFFLARRWVAYNKRIETEKNKHPQLFFTLTYEKMVDNMEDALQAICAFTGLPFYKTMLQNAAPEGYFENLQNIPAIKDVPEAKKNELVENYRKLYEDQFKPVSKENIGKWQTEMRPYDEAVTEIIAGNYAKEKYGYAIGSGDDKRKFISSYRLARSKVVYYFWERFTRFRFMNYGYNTRYKAKIIRAGLEKSKQEVPEDKEQKVFMPLRRMRSNAHFRKHKMDFVIVGAQKAGTTALFHHLRQHPQVALIDKKELHFFDNEKMFKNNAPDYNELYKHFTFLPEHKVAGECTPVYMFWNPSMPRIKEYNPDIKIIAILRNPVERAFSQWNMYKLKGEAPLDFYTYITTEDELIKQALPLQPRDSYVARGIYAEQVKRIYSLFKKENVLFLKYEDFKNQPVPELNKMFDFLGIDKNQFVFKDRKLLSLEYERKIKPEEKEYLLKVYTPSINELEKMLGWDCSDWKV